MRVKNFSKNSKKSNHTSFNFTELISLETITFDSFFYFTYTFSNFFTKWHWNISFIFVK